MAPPHRLAIELSGQDARRRLPPTEPLIVKRRSPNHRITAKRFSPMLVVILGLIAGCQSAQLLGEMAIRSLMLPIEAQHGQSYA